ncbi:rhomboid family intramembrane serine protease [Telmatocola sphagniphila]|uniref:Rhomboid family intramembrane serine protease n=1 Tax=Telmatocola sphagniphila TaxID=1123043 RepID=A0A8E6EUD6_9BACT|nr:rhomboid family intramembrane serine protease [Telmatocola sphagniphila]QVL33589.1 rhomboid family intramembrane serine protease [Telmatocola sphagniphila]
MPKTFTPPYRKTKMLALAAASLLLLYSKYSTPNGGGLDSGLLILLWIYALYYSAKNLIYPQKVLVQEGKLISRGLSNWETNASNVQANFYDGGGLRLRFLNLEFVQAEASEIEQLRNSESQYGTHCTLAGLTLEQIDELRALLPIAPPPFRSPAEQIESYHREMIRRKPIPLATFGLIAAIVFVFLGMCLKGISPFHQETQQLIDAGANYGPLTTNGDYFRLITNLFIHLGVLHLLCNAITLQILGTTAERIYGSARFLFLYFVSGLFGSIFSLLMQPEIVSAGASGCIFGIAGSIFAHVLLNKDSMPWPIYLAERKNSLRLIALNLLIGFGVPGIDNYAHLGGLAVGFLLGFWLGPQDAARTNRSQSRFYSAIVIGVVAIVLAVAFLPRIPKEVYQYLQALEEYGPKEAKILEEYNSLLGKWGTQKTPPSEMADEFERLVSKPFHELVTRFPDPKFSPASFREVAPVFQEFMEARDRSWRHTAEAVRTQNAELMRKATEEQKLAESLLEKQKDFFKKGN